MRTPLPILLIALHACACLTLQAQTTPVEPTALINTRAAFLRQVMTDSQLLTEQYERALAKVETEVATAGDYEEARAIRQRREQLRALYAGTVSSLATPLPLAQAKLMGSAQALGETIGGWRSNSSGAEWQNFRLMPGRYHLEFEANMSDAPVAGSIYASPKFQPQQSATFEFNEVTILGNAAESHRSFEVLRSTDETTFTTMRVGPLTFTRNPITLRFTSAAGYPANIIRIRNLRLVPVTDETLAVAATVAPTSSTTTLQQATALLKAAIDAAKKITTDAYLTELQTVAAAKPALKDQVDAESRRIKRSTDEKNHPLGTQAITSNVGSLDGFEDINNARLADGAPVSGERFSIVLDGRTLAVRLLWIDCAPVEEKDPGVKRFAKHFNIEDEDAAAMGRAAREFTSGYLRDKPLRLLIRPDRDKDGTLAALLFLPDVGLYQNILVDQGLAAVVAPPREARLSATEKALIATLDTRESAAKNRKPAPGAWALATESEGGKKQ